MRILGTFLALVFLAVLATGGAVAYFAWVFGQPGPLEETRYVMIDPGSSGKDIARTLYAQGVIDEPAAKLFPYVARVEPSGESLKAGEFEMTSGMSPYEVLRLLQSGKVVQRQVTIPEGLTSLEIVALLNDLDAVSGDPVTEIPAEGTILPESFAYARNHTRQQILKRMQDDMQKTLDALWETRAENLPIKTKEEAVILASIIEKETGVASERDMVAGVFINRLNRGMPLQTDPTVIYALTEGKSKMERPLYLKDLKIDHPYNTYIHAGLPPGPIANPGKASLKAALNPAQHDYLYFVADGTGGHAFAKTLEGHNRNVAAWRKIQRATD